MPGLKLSATSGDCSPNWPTENTQPRWRQIDYRAEAIQGRGSPNDRNPCRHRIVGGNAAVGHLMLLLLDSCHIPIAIPANFTAARAIASVGG
jgi:hypothetical protein